MSAQDRYVAIADFYDAMLPANPARNAFFDELFRRNNVKRILDCACGTGNDLIVFHTLGYSVCGSDLSEAMLAVARRKLHERHLKIPLRSVDFHKLKLHYKEEFDAVVCLSNAINEVEVDVEEALLSMQSVLRPNGIIVFDQGQTDFNMKNPPRYAPEVNNDDLSRLYFMDYEKKLVTVQVFDFIHSQKDNTYEFRRSEFKINIRLLADWERILAGVNMEAEYYGDWQPSLYNVNSSKRLIVVARQKKQR